eukprot:COSAG06_NODE_12113_length_1422_cov_1.037037_1_plen_62_part_10
MIDQPESEAGAAASQLLQQAGTVAQADLIVVACCSAALPGRPPVCSAPIVPHGGVDGRRHRG